jgi:hypothetical protein
VLSFEAKRQRRQPQEQYVQEQQQPETNDLLTVYDILDVDLSRWEW